MKDFVERAVREAVAEVDQPDELASQILAWLSALFDGRESLSDRDVVSRRLEALFERVTLVADDED